MPQMWLEPILSATSMVCSSISLPFLTHSESSELMSQSAGRPRLFDTWRPASCMSSLVMSALSRKLTGSRVATSTRSYPAVLAPLTERRTSSSVHPPTHTLLWAPMIFPAVAARQTGAAVRRQICRPVEPIGKPLADPGAGGTGGRMECRVRCGWRISAVLERRVVVVIMSHGNFWPCDVSDGDAELIGVRSRDGGTIRASCRVS
mmetsp:Transcript_26333/g.73989  ORF Transcript_26333/g.73989 Transcript_26333/m.73989 type:complete len:205 (-) Transcript_26333:105-719(-)